MPTNPIKLPSHPCYDHNYSPEKRHHPILPSIYHPSINQSPLLYHSPNPHGRSSLHSWILAAVQPDPAQPQPEKGQLYRHQKKRAWPCLAPQRTRANNQHLIPTSPSSTLRRKASSRRDRVPAYRAQAYNSLPAKGKREGLAVEAQSPEK